MDKYLKLVEGGPETYWEALQKIGWFDVQHYLESEVKAILESDIEDNTQLIASIGKLLLDESSYSDKDALEEFVEYQLVRVNGLIKELEIHVEEVDDGKLRLELKSASRAYTYIVDTNFEDKINSEFIDKFFNEILENQGIEERYFRIALFGDGIMYALVPPQYYEAALKEGIIPSDPAFRVPGT